MSAADWGYRTDIKNYCQQLIGDIEQILKIIVIAVTAFLRVGNHFKAHQFI